jgi:hypothetical protein
MLGKCGINKLRHGETVPQRLFSLISLFTHLGINIAKPLLSALVIQSMGTPTPTLSNLALFLLQPRPACIIAAICLFIPKWRGYAIQLLFADFILNLLCFGMTEFKTTATYPPSPTNPATPSHGLHFYQIGFGISIATGDIVYGILMIITTFGAIDLAIGLFSDRKDYPYRVFGAVVAFWIFLASFIVALPILAILEMIVIIINFCQKKPKDRSEPLFDISTDKSGSRWISMLSKPLRRILGNKGEEDWFDPNWFTWKVCLIYFVLLVASTASAVGNWMVTIELYGMAGEVWCPTGLKNFFALQILLPLLGHLLDAAFMTIS